MLKHVARARDLGHLNTHERLKRRHELDIYYDILRISRKASLKTHIAGAIRINYQRLLVHIDVLIRNGLLIEKKENLSICYFTSKKGLKFINMYEYLATKVVEA